MLLSICIPTKNRLGLLRETLNSLLGQIDDDVEVIVRDNGSNDGTQDYLATVAIPRMRILLAEQNGNFADNVNGLVRAVRGRFFMLLHDDDLLAPDAVKAIKHGLTRRPDTELLVGTCIFFSGNITNVIALHVMSDESLGVEAAFRRFLPQWELRAPSLVYRTPSNHDRDFYDECYGIAKDSVVLVDYMMRGQTTLVSALVGYYRMGKHSETNQKIFTAGWGDNLIGFARYVYQRFDQLATLREYRYSVYLTMYRGWQKDCGKHYAKCGRMGLAAWLLTGWVLTTITFGRIHFPPPAMLRENQK
jgi:glycosyltransferase involved in cell wall biosynthesis